MNTRTTRTLSLWLAVFGPLSLLDEWILRQFGSEIRPEEG
jgi:hypothetical protein